MAIVITNSGFNFTIIFNLASNEVHLLVSDRQTREPKMTIPDSKMMLATARYIVKVFAVRSAPDHRGLIDNFQ